MTNPNRPQLLSNVYIPLGLVFVLVPALIYAHTQILALNTELTTLQSEVRFHLSNPSLHHNMLARLETNYVSRGVFDSRIGNIEVSLKEMKGDLKQILAELNGRSREAQVEGALRR